MQAPVPAAVHSGKIKFAGDSGFHTELKARVQDYFRVSGRSPRGGLRMYLKSAVILLWLMSSYALLVFWAGAFWQAALLSASLAFAVAGAGFAVQHDANHGAYSTSRFVNRLMGFTLDMLGGSSYVWHWKHNLLHHSYPNMIGADEDINLQPFARLAPGQPRHRVHRVQQFYMWVLYGMLLLKWHLLDDFLNVAQGRISRNRIPRPRGWKALEVFGGKALFFGWALVLPMFFHRIWVVLAFYGATAFLVGVILAVVFQLAHCVEESAFPLIPAGSDHVEQGWAEHQVHTTADFARRNRLLTWYLGGLNFQVEHHLFPKICHVHYPQMSRIVEQVCAEHSVRYAAHDGIMGAIGSHWRWLSRMGRAVTPAEQKRVEHA
jgi:linoleoyl-CoA desaturase